MAIDFNILASLVEDGPMTLRVSGGCMRASIPRDSRVRVERRGWYAPGDVVTYHRGAGGIVTHRVLGYLPGRSGWRLITRADDAARADAPVSLASVLGCVTAVEGRSFRPTAGDRLRALVGWPPAVMDWLGKRCRG